MTACALSVEVADDLARTGLAALDGARFEDVAAHAVDHAARMRQLVDAMAELAASTRPRFSAARTRRMNGAARRVRFPT